MTCNAGSEQTVSDSGQPARDQQEYRAVQQHPERDPRGQHDQPGRHERGLPGEGERRIRCHGETGGFCVCTNIHDNVTECFQTIINFSDCRLWKKFLLTFFGFWRKPLLAFLSELCLACKGAIWKPNAFNRASCVAAAIWNSRVVEKLDKWLKRTQRGLLRVFSLSNFHLWAKHVAGLFLGHVR